MDKHHAAVCYEYLLDQILIPIFISKGERPRSEIDPILGHSCASLPEDTELTAILVATELILSRRLVKPLALCVSDIDVSNIKVLEHKESEDDLNPKMHSSGAPVLNRQHNNPTVNQFV